MSDGKVKMTFCKMRECYNQRKDNSVYCIIHHNLRQENE